MRLGTGRSKNVINVGGGGGGRGLGGVGLGLGGLVVLLVGAFFGVDLSGIAGAGGPAPVQSEAPAGEVDATQQWLIDVVSDTELVWGGLYEQAGRDYPEPTLVRFAGQVQSGCGVAGAQTGPFYCPADQRLYLDPTFFDELARMGAPGDFAAAYVIAHEVGHHIQNIEGTLGEVDRRKRTLPEAQANQLSVATELQADCYAGIWAHHAERDRNVLEEEAGEVEEGLAAAADRVAWFRRGLETGDVGQCDTFSRT